MLTEKEVLFSRIKSTVGSACDSAFCKGLKKEYSDLDRMNSDQNVIADKIMGYVNEYIRSVNNAQR